jgi:hypothetical protein
MKKIIAAPLVSLLLACPLYTFAGAELDQINAEVEAKAAQIDADHGILLTGQERNNLKIKLVAGKVVVEQTNDQSTELSNKIDQAVDTFEITDPVDQRQLVIEVQSVEGMDGDGIEPPK